jgi:hypothetical protein
MMRRRIFSGALLVLAGGVVSVLAQGTAAASSAPTQGGAATRSSATKPVVMKPISAAEEASYAASLESRAQAVLADLKLTDSGRAERVRQAVIAQYRALRAWHDTYDDDLKALSKNAAGNAAAITEIQETRVHLHHAFLAGLGRDLSAEQIEVVKDRMTYGTVKVTYDEYLRQNPWLNAEQRAKILDTLKEARELAMDDGSQKEKAATFGKYKGRINNLLSAWKKLGNSGPAGTSGKAAATAPR